MSLRVYIDDNFNGENGGQTQYDYRAWRNWSVVGSPVSLVGAGGFDPHPGNGLYAYILEQATQGGSVGLLSHFVFGPGVGRFDLEFRLGGNTGSPTYATISFGTYGEDFYVPRTSGFVAYSRTVDILATSEIRLRVLGGPVPGPVLDDVVLCLRV